MRVGALPRGAGGLEQEVERPPAQVGGARRVELAREQEGLLGMEGDDVGDLMAPVAEGGLEPSAVPVVEPRALGFGHGPVRDVADEHVLEAEYAPRPERALVRLDEQVAADRVT